MIKKIFLTIAIVVLSLASYSQSAVKQAESAYAAGNYSDATQLYELAASTTAGNEAERNRLYAAANKCREISSLHTKADKAYAAKNYKVAMDNYNMILKLNPNDKVAKTRKEEYNYTMKNLAESADWEKVNSCKTFAEKVVKAREFLKKYPSGRYKKEASNIVAEEDRWQKAKKLNTYEAYQDYIDNSTMDVYLSAANAAITEIDDDLWLYAKTMNTREAYLEYLSTQKNRNGKHLKEAEALSNLVFARNMYNQGEYDKAYEFFLKGKTYATTSDVQKMEYCLKYKLYSKACSSSGTIKDCQDYLKKYPYSYRDDNSFFFKVEDKLMRLLCNEGRFNEAMKYARLKSEKKFVKKAQKAWKKSHK